MEQKYSLNHLTKGFPGVSDGKDLPAVQETQVWPLGQEDPLEKGMPTQFTGELHGQRSPVGSQSQIRLSD